MNGSQGLLAGSAVAVAVVLAGARLRVAVGRPLPARTGVDVAPPPRRRAGAIGAGVGCGFVTALLAGPAVSIVVAGAATALALRRRQQRQRSRLRAIEATMPDAVELLVVCLHAGLSPAQAIAELARLAPEPVRPGFVAVETRLHRGAAFGDALAELTAECGRSAAALVASLGTAVRDGLPLAPVLDRLGDEATASRRRAGEAAARRLPVRLSFPLVACTLPSFVLLAIAPAVLGALSTVRGSSL